MYGAENWTLRKGDNRTWKVLNCGADQLDRSYEKLKCYKESGRRGISYIHEKKEGYLDWSLLAYELRSKTRY